MRYSTKLIEELEEKAYQIRKLSIQMISRGKTGHPGGSLSEADILAALYFHILRIDPKKSNWEDRDRFVLSKAHACVALYAALALRGFFSVEELFTYGFINSRLQGHPDMKKTPGIEISGGSLGQGLSVAVGMALGATCLNKFFRVFCIVGDGEMNEGQIWEAAMSAAHYHLDNLIAIVDYNKVQAKGFCHRIMGIEPVVDKWKSFGWNVLEVDGHNMEQILEIFHIATDINRSSRPTVIIAHTIKGKGVPWMEFNSEWHTHPPNEKQTRDALENLERAYKEGQKQWKK